MRLIKNKGFTLIELLVTIAVLGILILLGAPRLTSYVQEAQLTRIQHDVKVMEQEMKIVLLENESLEGFDYNAKDLGLLIEANRLFEKEGHAGGLEYVPAEGEINGLSKKDRKISSKANSEIVGVGGVEYSTYDELGVGGDEIKIEEEKEFKEIYERYKIVPDNYKGEIKTRLKGTFYTNENGKVYYEPDKPNKIKTEPRVLNCDIALPDYEFEPASGKIVKWHGTEQHLIIPSHFLVDDECVPVRIIGEGAFMQGGFKSIMIPPSVLIIERNAFKESGVDSISIPESVREIRQGAFDGIGEVVYLGRPSRVNNGSGPGTYLAPDGSIKNIIHRHPSAGEAGVVFHPGSGTIVRGSNRGSIPEYIHVGGRDVRVRKVAKGAYQGLGLITVILPETLEIIEDYSFSGNQLIGVTIPNSVYHIGHYAFSFNEVWHEDNQNDRKATIKTVIIKEDEQFEEIDKVGNIVKDGIKVNLLEANSGELGPNVKLLNHIWVTSINNIVIDVKYGPVGSGDEVIPDGYEMAELEDFEFVPDSAASNEYHGNRGYYRYVGDKEYVVIPHIIQDVELKDYYKMFEGSNVKGVASDNKNVTNMSNMFHGSASRSIELKYLDTSSVTNMYGMFYRSNATTLDLSSFDTSSVTDMRYMFWRSQATALDLSSFDTSSVTNMTYMFSNSQATTLDLSSFDTSSVTSMGAMLQDSQATIGYARTAIEAGKFNNSVYKPSTLTFVVKGDLDKPQPPTNKPDGYVIAKQEDFQFVVSTSAPNTYNGTKGHYKYVGKDDKIVIPHIIYGNEIKDYYNMFAGSNVKGVASDNKNVPNMNNMFEGSNSTSIELKYLDTSSVTNMNYMFRNAKATALDLSSFDTSSVTSMSQMFQNSQATTLDLSSFDTSSVTNMGAMFRNSRATTLDLSSFDTSSTNMSWIFWDSQAIIGYARTETDAGKFNSSSYKPSKLKFVVKP